MLPFYIPSISCLPDLLQENGRCRRMVVCATLVDRAAADGPVIRQVLLHADAKYGQILVQPRTICRQYAIRCSRKGNRIADTQLQKQQLPGHALPWMDKECRIV